MDSTRSGPEIANLIRRKIVYEGLELQEIGIGLADVTDDVRLFEEDGLNLDSIDALEIVAGVQREFGLSLPNVDQAFIDEHCATVGRLASMVTSMTRDAAPQAQAPTAAPGTTTPDPNAATARVGSATGS